MTFTTAKKTVDFLRQLFGRFRHPNNIADYNDPQFSSACSNNGIFHTSVAHYQPSSNGQAERFVSKREKKLDKIPNQCNNKT